MKRLLLATALIAAPMLAPPSFAKGLAADAPKIDPAKLSAHIKVLASDAFEGRGPATAGEDQDRRLHRRADEGHRPAARRRPLEEWAGSKRAWTQDVPLARFENKGPVAVSVTVGGHEADLAQGDDRHPRGRDRRRPT
jgi:uncharacterized low-complexity protein